MIVSRMIVAAILPALFYAAPAWCGAVRHLARLRPLDRVLRLCGMCTLGLLCTVSGDAARTISGLLSAEFQLSFSGGQLLHAPSLPMTGTYGRDRPHP